MRIIIRFCIALLLLVFPGGLVGAQDSALITVTGLYASYPPGGEYQEILTPCDNLEVWDVVSKGPAFTALAQVYTSLETSGQFLRNENLFVEVRGRYTPYTGESHSDGIFVITEFVRHSTAAADITACNTNSPDSPDLEDGQCGSTRNSCLAGHSFDHDMANLADTATEYRWECLGLSGGDSVVCTAPKAP